MKDEELAYLKLLRTELLHLHKCLLDFQKHKYESTQGKIPSVGKYFELVTQHKDFEWLKTVSEFIVSIDTVLEGKSENEPSAADIIEYAKKLFLSEPPLNEFAAKYLEAVTEDPAVSLAHGKIAAYVKKRL